MLEQDIRGQQIANLFERCVVLSARHKSYQMEVFIMLHKIYSYKELKRQQKIKVDPKLEEQVSVLDVVIKGFEVKREELLNEYQTCVDFLCHLRGDNLKSQLLEEADIKLAEVISIRKNLDPYELKITKALKEDI